MRRSTSARARRGIAAPKRAGGNFAERNRARARARETRAPRHRRADCRCRGRSAAARARAVGSPSRAARRRFARRRRRRADWPVIDGSLTGRARSARSHGIIRGHESRTCRRPDRRGSARGRRRGALRHAPARRAARARACDPVRRRRAPSPRSRSSTRPGELSIGERLRGRWTFLFFGFVELPGRLPDDARDACRGAAGSQATCRRLTSRRSCW